METQTKTEQVEEVVVDKTTTSRKPDFVDLRTGRVAWTGQTKAGNAYLKVVDNRTGEAFFLVQNFKD